VQKSAANSIAPTPDSTRPGIICLRDLSSASTPCKEIWHQI